MNKKIIVIETDSSFFENLERNFKKEKLIPDFEIERIIPTSKIKIEVIEFCLEKIKILLDKNDIYCVLIDICIIDGKSYPLGIEIAKKIREVLPQVPIFNITNKTEQDKDFDSLSEASLEDIDGVLVKSYLEGENFSKERFNNMFEKAHKKRAISPIANFEKTKLEKTNYEIAIITALDNPEFTALKKIINNYQVLNKNLYKIDENTIYFEGKVSGKNQREINVIIATEDTLGMPSIGCLSTRIITNFHPKYLIILGIAAGIEGKTKIGDILIAEYCWDYGCGKLDMEKGKEVFKPYIQQLKLDEELRQLFIKYKSEDELLNKIRLNYNPEPDTILKLHIGPFASGSAVIANDSFVFNLKEEHKKLIGFDMESYAVFKAAEAFPSHLKPKVISIKSVSDFGNSKKNNDLQPHHQSYAAFTSTMFFKEFISREF